MRAAAAESAGLVPPSAAEFSKVAELGSELAQAQEKLAEALGQVQEARDTATHNAVTAGQCKALGLKHQQHAKQLSNQVLELRKGLRTADSTAATLRQQLLDAEQASDTAKAQPSETEAVAELRGQQEGGLLLSQQEATQRLAC